MKIISNILYFEYKDLIELGFSADTITKFDKLRNSDDTRKFLYPYDKIAQRSSKTRDKLPNKELLLARLKEDTIIKSTEQTEECINNLPQAWAIYINAMDIHWFGQQLSTSTADNIGKKTRDLATGMAIFRLLDNCQKKNDVKQFTGFNNKEELIRALATTAERMDIYGLPCSYDRLRVKYYDYRKALDNNEEPRWVLIPKTFGNTNTQKLTDEHKAIIDELYLRTNKPDRTTVYEIYTEQCSLYSMKPVAYRTLLDYLSSNFIQALAVRERDGKGAYETRVKPHVKRYVNYSLSLIAGDGWVPGRAVMHKDKNGKTVEKRMTVWLWYDWKSRAILGHSIASEENSQQIRLSFRRIINVLDGKIPMSVMMDKRWQMNPEIQQMFTKLGVIIQDKRAFNPKSNIAERSNKYMNKFHRTIETYWANMTPGVSAENRHNPEALRDATTITEKEFSEQILQVISLYNTSKLESLGYRSPIEVFESAINPEVKTIDHLQRRWAFGNTKIVTVRNGYLQLEIASKKYEYFIPKLSEFLKYNIKNNKVRVYYDEEFLDTVDIYSFDNTDDTSNDTYITTCETVERMNASKVEQKEKDLKLLGKMMSLGTELDQELDKHIATNKQLLNELTDGEVMSVHQVSQERFKQIQESNFMKMYRGVYHDYVEIQPAQPVTKKQKVLVLRDGTEEIEEQPLSAKEKNLRLTKNNPFEE